MVDIISGIFKQSSILKEDKTTLPVLRRRKVNAVKSPAVRIHVSTVHTLGNKCSNVLYFLV